MRTLLTLGVSILLWSCSAPEEKVAKSAHADHQRESATSTELALNNGAKWKADAATKANVASLITVLGAFNASEARTLAEYLDVATKIQVVLDKLIGDCEMQGPDHDALHLWLHPLLERLDALHSSSTAEEARRAYAKVNEQARLYSTYFE